MSIHNQPPLTTAPAAPAATPTAGDSAPSRQLAASYARSAQADPPTIVRQHAINVAAAARDGFVVPDAVGFRWADDGWSGCRSDRPAYRALLAAVEAGQVSFTRLYVTDASRLLRSSDVRERFWLEFQLEGQGVSVCYAASGYDDARPAAEAADADTLRESLAITDVVTRMVEGLHASAVRTRRRSRRVR